MKWISSVVMNKGGWSKRGKRVMSEQSKVKQSVATVYRQNPLKGSYAWERRLMQRTNERSANVSGSVQPFDLVPSTRQQSPGFRVLFALACSRCHPPNFVLRFFRPFHLFQTICRPLRRRCHRRWARRCRLQLIDLHLCRLNCLNLNKRRTQCAPQWRISLPELMAFHALRLLKPLLSSCSLQLASV